MAILALFKTTKNRKPGFEPPTAIEANGSSELESGDLQAQRKHRKLGLLARAFRQK